MPRVWDEIISIVKGNARALESECDAMQDSAMYSIRDFAHAYMLTGLHVSMCVRMFVCLNEHLCVGVRMYLEHGIMHCEKRVEATAEFRYSKVLLEGVWGWLQNACFEQVNAESQLDW